MRSSVSPKQGSDRRLNNSRTRKRHKRLDAICEETYNRNRGLGVEQNAGNRGMAAACVEAEPRRSTRARRPPVMLDASPPPAKKRRKIGKNGERINNHVERVKEESSSKGHHSPDASSGDAEEPDSWRSRLRSRVSGRSFGMEKRESPRGKRKLVKDLEGVKEEPILKDRELDEKKRGMDGGKLTVMYSRRPGRIKATNVLRHEDKEIELITSREDDSGRKEVEMTEANGEERPLVLESVSCGGNDREADDGDNPRLDWQEVGGVRTDVQFECTYTDNVETEERTAKEPEHVEVTEEGEKEIDSVEAVEKTDKEPEQLEGAKEGEKEIDSMDAVGFIPMQAEARGSCDCGNASNIKFHKNPAEDDTVSKMEEANHVFVEKIWKLQMKEGRRCGLCGGASDGKPPKRLVHDMAESDNEACSGSSASEEPNYDIWDGFGDEPSWLGRLLGPINDRFGIAGTWVHQHCAVWSPEVYFSGLGCLKNIRAALCRGRGLKCNRCGRSGATTGCRVDRCPKTYHLPCARANGCHFDHRKFLIACTDHRHVFQPHGNRYLDRIKKMKARKMKLEVRKLSNDALRKDVEAEEKWLENCGEDEEFLRRESKRLHRDILRIAPVYIGGPTIESEHLFQGWDSVAGLQDVVRCMKEVVILPLLYPEFFDNMGLTPPRGVLLHGYPGTGKTLVVRALIGSCARGDKRIAYFARKGADCLGKYVGDAERQLRLLFQVAEKSQPSIIFFDEIDGLAPRRTRQQDQTHSSVVSTLLALLDGLKSRGSVVVIGATNRPEAVDPALRRPGRFDREIYFPLPSLKDRAAILSLHTQRWPKPVSGSLLQWIARQTAGFAGADLQALCTQVAMVALKRNRPLQEILSAAGEKSSNVKRRPLPNFVVEERDWLEALACVPIPCSRREAGMAANDVVSSPLHMHLVPCLLQPLSSLLVSLYLDDRIWLPPPLSKAAAMIKEVIFSALEKKKIPDYYWWSHVQDMLQEIDVAREIEKGLSCASILMGEASFSLSDPLNGENDDACMVSETSKVYHGTRSSLLQNMALPLRKKLGYRVLIAGSPKSGQRHVASFLLHYLFGDVKIQKVDLATIAQEGRGDIVQGITQILMKCSSVRSSVVFMPRIDLWALHQEIASVETDSHSSDPQSSVERNSSRLEHSLVSEKNNSSIGASKSTDAAEMEAAPRASHAWNSFIEQVESLCVSTSLIILATSEVPYPKLPPRVRQLFKSDILYFSHSASSRGTTPHFVVQIDGNFNHDMVISSSTTELAKDLVQLFVQLTHDRTHNVGSCWESKVCNTIEDTARHGIEDESGNEPDNRVQHPEDSAAEAPFPPYNRPVKGKSNLLLAITTFGYQILLYPHFAELCWVTSKLKEGPCTDTNGPWKGWPFNTCIVHPADSLVRAAVVSGPGNIKSKEKSGLVRGLIAVGLSAYRGVYASLREVASEVRKVLELLVGQINTKIQAGKDRCQFIRILSQVAYLEDVVNSWVYTLQSLEQGAQTAVGNPKVASLVCPDNVRSCIGAIQSVGSMPDVPNGGSRVQTTVDSQCGYLEKVDADSISPDSKVTPAIAEESPNSGGKIFNKQIDTNFESCPLDNTRKPALPNGNCAPLKSSEGSGHTESVVLSKDGLFSLYDLGAVKLPTSKGAPEKVNGLLMAENGSQSKNGAPSPDDHDMNISSSPNKTTSLSADSEVACLYCCCAGCLNTLHSLIQKILVREWEMNGNHWTVDGVHDVVTSLSVYLLSEVRKLYGTRSFSSSIDEKLRHEKDKEKLEHQAADACGCKNSGNSRAELMECGCHSLPTPSIFQLGNVLKFIYRNGVLLPVNSDEDVPLHCKFERLCLCTLIEWILWIKKPSD